MLFDIVTFLLAFLPGLPVLTAAIPVLTVSVVIIVLGIPVTSLVRTVPKAHGIIFVVIYLIASFALLGGAVSAVSLYGQLSLLPSFGAVPVASSVDGLLDALATLLVMATCAWTAADGLRVGVRVLSTPRRLRLRRAHGRHVASRALVSRRSPSQQQVRELQDILKASQEQVAALKAERDAVLAERDEAGTVSAVALEQLRVTIARLESEAEAARAEATTATATAEELRNAARESVSEKDAIIAQKDVAIAGQKATIEDLHAAISKHRSAEDQTKVLVDALELALDDQKLEVHRARHAHRKEMEEALRVSVESQVTIKRLEAMIQRQERELTQKDRTIAARDDTIAELTSASRLRLAAPTPLQSKPRSEELAAAGEEITSLKRQLEERETQLVELASQSTAQLEKQKRESRARLTVIRNAMRVEREEVEEKLSALQVNYERRGTYLRHRDQTLEVLREKIDELEQRASATLAPQTTATIATIPKATTSKRSATTPSGIKAPSGRKSTKENAVPASAVPRAKTPATKESSMRGSRLPLSRRPLALVK